VQVSAYRIISMLISATRMHKKLDKEEYISDNQNPCNILEISTPPKCKDLFFIAW
jgi:hypothetical protein